MQLLWQSLAAAVVPASSAPSLMTAVAASPVVVIVVVLASVVGVELAAVAPHSHGGCRPRRQRRPLLFAAASAPGHCFLTCCWNRLEHPPLCADLMPRHVSRQLRIQEHLPCTESAGLHRFVHVSKVLWTCSLQASRPWVSSVHTSHRAAPTASRQQPQVALWACAVARSENSIARTLTTTAADFRTPDGGYTPSPRRSNFRGVDGAGAPAVRSRILSLSRPCSGVAASHAARTFRRRDERRRSARSTARRGARGRRAPP